MEDFSNAQVGAEFERWCAQIPDDPYRGQTTLGIIDVLRAHFLIADFFEGEGAGISAAGPMNLDLLHSAMYRQFGEFEKRSRFEVCATLFYGIIKNHCFYDANKRTALLSLLYHMERVGYCPTVSQQQIENFAVEVANDELPKRYARYGEVKKKSAYDPNVAFIADYLSRNSRKVENDNHVITYRQLEKILFRHGFRMENPSANTIDIIRYEERRFLGFARKAERTRIGMIGFPGMSIQVSRGDIKKVRIMTKLDYKNNVDSAAFYGKLDPISTLITTYQQPLRRLANR
ncbi:death-on-curing protein [Humitalea rosea]|uniref:Death-on-curing protein n=2 Tax=Humitalea rosea TaxID=990373 RepID=A0A2W7IAF9_9PROT|nr:death-on-curing protein [Humitalea rosea]